MNDNAARFEDFLTSTDAGRATRVLERLQILGLTEFALVGAHPGTDSNGVRRATTALNDIDIIVPGLSSLPDILNDEFLVFHIHPRATEGRLLVQMVDAEEAFEGRRVSGGEGAMIRSCEF